jgi:hypothetical protein
MYNNARIFKIKYPLGFIDIKVPAILEATTTSIIVFTWTDGLYNFMRT